MKFSSKRRERIFTVFFMFAISVFCISILTGVSLVSRDRIRANQALASKRALLTAARMPVPDDQRTLDAIFSNQVKAYTNAGGRAIYSIRQGASSDPSSGRRQLLGFVFEGRGQGLWGGIRAWVGVRADRKHLMSLAITEHSETPGLGARIDEPWFGKQFSGKTGPLTARPEKTASSLATEFDGITGATATIDGVRSMLNTVLSNAPGDIAAIARTDADLSNAVFLYDAHSATNKNPGGIPRKEEAGP